MGVRDSGCPLDLRTPLGAFPEVWERAEQIPGWLSENEGRALYYLCRSPWCEIGSWYGRSSVILASRGHGYCIDSFHGSPEMDEASIEESREKFLINTNGLPITLIEKMFEDASDDVPNGLRFLFLDADHSYEQTKLAIDLFGPKVAKDGVVVFHDAIGGHWPGVERVVAELRPPIFPAFVAERMMICRRI